jgi:hypothetical protein
MDWKNTPLNKNLAAKGIEVVGVDISRDGKTWTIEVKGGKKFQGRSLGMAYQRTIEGQN